MSSWETNPANPSGAARPSAHFDAAGRPIRPSLPNWVWLVVVRHLVAGGHFTVGGPFANSAAAWDALFNGPAFQSWRLGVAPHQRVVLASQPGGELFAMVVKSLVFDKFRGRGAELCAPMGWAHLVGGSWVWSAAATAANNDAAAVAAAREGTATFRPPAAVADLVRTLAAALPLTPAAPPATDRQTIWRALAIAVLLCQ